MAVVSLRGLWCLGINTERVRHNVGIAEVKGQETMRYVEPGVEGLIDRLAAASGDYGLMDDCQQAAKSLEILHGALIQIKVYGGPAEDSYAYAWQTATESLASIDKLTGLTA